MDHRSSPIPALKSVSPERFRSFSLHHLDEIPALARLSPQQRFDIRVVATVLPFRVNQYVTEQLIDWHKVPDDPMFRLVFPQPEMLAPEDFSAVADALREGAPKSKLAKIVGRIRSTLNPHPAQQASLNVPMMDGKLLEGIQHKYDETVLYFPARGQVCHSYCTFCFRWAQFVGDRSLRFASSQPDDLAQYLKHRPKISDVLITGGDPMVMKAHHLEHYIEPLLNDDLEHVRSIRIGTKSLSFWPHRFVSDPDAGEMLRLLERCVSSEKHVAIMAHYNHWCELDTPIAREAIRRIRDTGAVIRSQGPLLRRINDDAAIWSRLWDEQVRLGIFPYYLFIERDTGAKSYFEVPLAKAWKIYRDATKQVSGLARTARGPSMSTSPGKIEVQGVSDINGEKVFVLRFIQGRNPDWVQQPFFARYDPDATWFDQLEPAFGEKRFFFENDLSELSHN